MNKKALSCFAVLLLGWLLLTFPVTPPLLASPTESNLLVGVNMHPVQNTYAPSQISQQVALLRQLRAEVVRIDIHWAWMEPTGPGAATWNPKQVARLDAFLDEMEELNIKVLATVLETPCWASTAPQGCAIPTTLLYPPANPQDYANFVDELVLRYRGRIHYWEVWNEPNYHGFWVEPDPAAYTALLQATYPVIKARDPHALVLGGALAPWDGDPDHPLTTLDYLEGMYAAGAKGYFDKLSYHPYTDGNTPIWYDARWPMHSYSHSVPALRQIMQAHADSSAIWLTEIGWTTVPPDTCQDCWTPTLPVTEAEQAIYLAEAIQIAQGWDYVETFLWYELIDMLQPVDPDVVSFEQYFGLFRRDYTPKPVVTAFRTFTRDKVFLPLLGATLRDVEAGPFRTHETTSIGSGVFADATFSDGLASFSEAWLWANDHFHIQRIRPEENPGGCDTATLTGYTLWVGTSAEASVLVNGQTIGTIDSITPAQRHGYLVRTAIRPGDRLCLTPVPVGGFQLIFGPDVYYHYDSYCYRGNC